MQNILMNSDLEVVKTVYISGFFLSRVCSRYTSPEGYDICQWNTPCNTSLEHILMYYVCKRWFLLSSSKCVSVPSLPGTEHTRRAFKNVVHLFTRLRCPPISFYDEKKYTIKSKRSTNIITVAKMQKIHYLLSIFVLVCSTKIYKWRYIFLTLKVT